VSGIYGAIIASKKNISANSENSYRYYNAFVVLKLELNQKRKCKKKGLARGKTLIK